MLQKQQQACVRNKATAGVEDLSVEAEALSFVCAFLATSEQDIVQKMDFLEQLGTLCEAMTVEGFRLFPLDRLIQVVEGSEARAPRRVAACPLCGVNGAAPLLRRSVIPVNDQALLLGLPSLG
ncbi:UNVERIFIED_CONTAM: hypothetical protein K2H54_015646 [Gekko kuhli]